MREPIAIIGMAGRFPKAKTLADFWTLLRDGVEVIERIPEHMIDSRRDASGRLPPEFVPMGAYLEDTEYFDCGLFGVSRRDAMIMDPQQRLFVEQVFAAAEDAGYDVPKLGGRVAVYAGAGPSRHPLDAMEAFGHDSATMFEVIATGIDKPMAMRVSHLFGLTGESLYVYAACATSLVAIDMAVNALVERRADAAIAGASVLYLPQMEGYDYAEGAVRSSDGRCRAFDAAADGTVWGSGVGVVILKRLSDALAARDHVRAVILGSAVNNDGAAKSSFAAPGRDGQADVIATALERAGVVPADIDFVEAHGTGTEIGDPMEVDSLNQVFGLARGPATCVLGSVKTNIGHLDPAAGIAGLFKTVLALENETIPATLHYRTPNPSIDFAAGPFAVNAANLPWRRGGRPRRAGINSFGVGGTNAHLVVGEAPIPARRPASARHAFPLTFSARTASALETMLREQAGQIEASPMLELRDIAFTRNCGRRAFPVRKAFVATDAADLARQLRKATPPVEATERPKLAFVFPGQGSQAVDMASGLYLAEPLYRSAFDACADILVPLLGEDIRELVYPEVGREAEAAERLKATDVQQPTLFCVSYALAVQFEAWGLRAGTMIGHSVGEFVAAVLAGTMDSAAALRILVARGRAMQACAPGGMTAVMCQEATLGALMPEALDVAAVNAAASLVVAGPIEALAELERRLDARGIGHLRLATSHAFHSRAMQGAVAAVETAVAAESLAEPKRPWISTVTGRRIESAEAVDPAFWASQIVRPVRFAEAVATAAGEGIAHFLELGGRRVLAGLVAAELKPVHRTTGVVVSATAPDPAAADAEHAHCEALGRLWEAGAPVDWNAVHASDDGRRVSLPHYPFEGEWVALTRPGERTEARRSPFGTTAQAAPAISAGSLGAFHAPAPGAARAARRGDMAVAFAPPANPLEAGLADMLGRLLGIHAVGADDTIFDLGGHSIMLVHIANQIRATHGRNVPIREIVAHPSVRGLARLLTERYGVDAGEAVDA